MYSCKSLINKPVLLATNSTILGNVRSFAMTDRLNAVAYLTVIKEGGAQSAIHFVAGCDIVSIQPDSLVVRMRPDMVDAPIWGIPVTVIRNREVVSRMLQPVGAVEDVMLDSTGAVVGIQLGDVVVGGPLMRTKFVPQDAIVSADNSHNKIRINLRRANACAMQPLSMSSMLAGKHRRTAHSA